MCPPQSSASAPAAASLSASASASGEAHADASAAAPPPPAPAPEPPPPAPRLQHEELAARFGVSRTPIREALRQLQALNLVELAPNRGATVRTPSRAELVEVYELRAEMEGFACALACDRASTEELDELERTQERLTEAVASAGHID